MAIGVAVCFEEETGLGGGGGAGYISGQNKLRLMSISTHIGLK